MNWEKIKGIVRHVLTFGAGYLVAADIIPQDEVEGVVVAVMTLIGVVWSWVSKNNQEEAA